MENNKAVSTVTLKATPEVLKDGVTCEVSNEYGKDSKVFPVILKGQCREKTRKLMHMMNILMYFSATHTVQHPTLYILEAVLQLVMTLVVLVFWPALQVFPALLLFIGEII